MLFSRRLIMLFFCVVISASGLCWGAKQLSAKQLEAKKFEDNVSNWRSKSTDVIVEAAKKIVNIDVFDLAKFGGLVIGSGGGSSQSTLTMTDIILNEFQNSAQKGAARFLKFFLATKQAPDSPHEFSNILDTFNFFMFAVLNRYGSFNDVSATVTLFDKYKSEQPFNFYDSFLRAYVRNGGEGKFDALYSESGNDLLIKFRDQNTNQQVRFRWLGNKKATGIYYFFDSAVEGSGALRFVLTDVGSIKQKAGRFSRNYIDSSVFADKKRTKIVIEVKDLLEVAALLLVDSEEDASLWTIGGWDLLKVINNCKYISVNGASTQTKKSLANSIKRILTLLEDKKNSRVQKLFGPYLIEQVEQLAPQN